MNSPLLTIITPCFNHGVYLDDLIASVHVDDWCFPIQHIIINDGSTDISTIDKLIEIERNYTSKITIVNQENKGLGHARNKGLDLAKGKYILPLDADNKIDANNIIRGVLEFETEKENTAVLYGDALRFGEVDEFWEMGHFDRGRLLKENYIDACAIIRTDALRKVGGYSTNMPYMGWEDWDLWLRFISFNFCFKYTSVVLFHYRVARNSMINLNNKDPFSFYLTRLYLAIKYSDLYSLEKNLIDDTLIIVRDLYKSVVTQKDLAYSSTSYKLGRSIVYFGSFIKRILGKKK